VVNVSLSVSVDSGVNWELGCPKELDDGEYSTPFGSELKFGMMLEKWLASLPGRSRGVHGPSLITVRETRATLAHGSRILGPIRENGWPLCE
jgi:hypothetical protein